MKLLEVAQPTMSPELIQYLTQYLTDLHILDYTTLSQSGRLIVNGNVDFPEHVTSIEFPFESVTGYFDCSGTKITSLKNAPLHVGDHLYCNRTNLASLEYVPQVIDHNVYIRLTKIISLKGIHKTHRNWKIGGTLFLPPDCADIVGLALIEGIKTVRLGGPSFITPTGLEFDISDNDPHAFQEKLLDAGLRAQARM